MNKKNFKSKKEKQSPIKNFHLTSISPKTKLICYEEDGIIHTSLWRRHETWQNIFIRNMKSETEI